MKEEVPNGSHAPLFKHVSDIVGDEHLETSEAGLSVFATDLFFRKSLPLAAVSPGSVEELARVTTLVTESDLAVVPRGGGLSYSAGYLADRGDSVLIDTRRLNKIIEINSTDMYVHVEAGVTWYQLNQALEEKQLRTLFWGTGSGLYATIGGTLSQNAVRMGSGRFGTAAENVLCLAVVLANGSILRTGSWGAKENPTPFSRYYGPDLTGLFLGDTGGLGIKAEIVLPLTLRPSVEKFLAYEFPDLETFAAGISAVGRRSVASESSGMDPFFLSERVGSTGFADDVEKLVNVAKAQGVKAAFQVAIAGRRFIEGLGYTLHMSIDGRDEADAESSLRVLREACEDAGGTEIEASIPRVARAEPFPPPYMIFGPKGERWIPLHGIVPHSRLVDTLKAVEQYMDSQSQLVRRHGVEWGLVCSPIGRTGALIEPSFYWRDDRTPMIEKYLDDAHLAGLPTYCADDDARAAVGKFREDLAQVFKSFGSIHLQIGRMYPYLQSRTPEVQSLLKALKKHVDPQGLMNPGVLGLE